MYWRDVLRSELERRSRKNPRYSLRAFAKSLEVDAAALWRVLSGRRALSLVTARTIADKLGFGAEAKKLFLASVAKEREGKKLEAVTPGATTPSAATALPEALFDAIGDWEHFAILEMSYLGDGTGVEDDPDFIARRLGVTPAVARTALERLLFAGLLEAHGGKLRKKERELHVPAPRLPGAALRRHQTQLLEKARAAVDGEKAARRAYTTLILPTDPRRLETARRMIEDFAWQLCRHLSDGARTDVYALTIGLCPLTQPEEFEGEGR